MSYDSALAALRAEDRQAVEHELSTWTGDDDAPVAENIRRETSLPHGVFVQLLAAFSAVLPTTVADGPDLFDVVCRGYKLKGPSVRGIPPRVLGRAVPMADLVEWLLGHPDLPPDIFEEELRHLIRLCAGRPEGITALLGGQVPLGRHVIWATFRNPDRNRSPFLPPLDTRAAVRTALGLGLKALEQPWVVLVYLIPDSPRQGIHMPTVADAGSYRYFSPVNDAAEEEHGWTKPLDHDPPAFPPQPEVVHADDLDYRVTDLIVLD